MFDTVLTGDMVLSLLLPLAWAAATLLVGHAASGRSPRGRRRAAWAALATAAFAAALAIGRLITVGQLWSYGWWFAQDRALVALPVLLLPALGVMIWTLPWLWRLARTPHLYNDVPPSGGESVGRTLPVQATALGAFAGAYLTLRPLEPFTTRAALTAVGVYGVAVGLLWWWRRRARAQPLLSSSASRGRVPRPVIAFVLLVTAGTLVGYARQASLLPARLDMSAHTVVDQGGGSEHEHRAPEGGTSVTALTGPQTGAPDRQFTLVAQQARIMLRSGVVVEALSFNGQSPGPELRVRQGELIEVTLVNRDVADGVTVHWHGVDVPNAEDGVAGVTQDAVRPGKQHVYRFVAPDAGTYWYHSHQMSAVQVKRGLFGAFVVEPRDAVLSAAHDEAVIVHTWDTARGPVTAFGLADLLEQRGMPPGTAVRLRLINTNDFPLLLALNGAPFRVVAIDGHEVHEPGELIDADLRLAAGGRYDLEFTMPAGAVRLSAPIADFDGGVPWANPDGGLLFSPDGHGAAPPYTSQGAFDPLNYGTPQDTLSSQTGRFDRVFVQYLGSRPGFYNGKLQFLWTINGQVFPQTPMLLVDEGDLVKLTIVNRSQLDHPMHLHGHHMLVLGRNGQPARGSHWWADTLNVAPGEVFEVAFVADNPGIWMDHCHNLEHAVIGMMLHLSYEGVRTPFVMGEAPGNHPE